MGKIIETTVLGEFKDYIKFEKGLSENSVNAYESDLKLFFDWIKSKNIKTEDITKEDIIAYLEYMNKVYSRFSVLRKITAIRVFYLYCFKEKEIKKNPAENLEKMHAWSASGTKDIKYHTRALLMGGSKEKVK